MGICLLFFALYIEMNTVICGMQGKRNSCLSTVSDELLRGVLARLACVCTDRRQDVIALGEHHDGDQRTSSIRATTMEWCGRNGPLDGHEISS